MAKIDYSFPLPEEKLIARYKSAFEKLAQGFSATILSIPHLGHTSHLRFLALRPDVLKKMGLKNHQFVFIDRDKVVGGYESFASELLIGLDSRNLNSSAVNSQNAYILNKEIISQTIQITPKKPVIIAMVIERKLEGFISEIENLMLLIQKSVSAYPVSILWITDTATARMHKSEHPSSTFLTNISYQQNFDKEETNYCLKRQSLLKGKKVSVDILYKSLVLTGGFACTFHQFINTGEILNSEYVKSSLLNIKKETGLNPNLVTKEGLEFLQSLNLTEVEFESIKLRSTPSAQEINLIRAFQKNIEKPISRDEIAQILWGKASASKYSDWAIDKAISRLRKNILSANYKIITVKNLGYELIRL